MEVSDIFSNYFSYRFCPYNRRAWSNNGLSDNFMSKNKLKIFWIFLHHSNPFQTFHKFELFFPKQSSCEWSRKTISMMDLKCGINHHSTVLKVLD